METKCTKKSMHVCQSPTDSAAARTMSRHTNRIQRVGSARTHTRAKCHRTKQRTVSDRGTLGTGSMLSSARRFGLRDVAAAAAGGTCEFVAAADAVAGAAPPFSHARKPLLFDDQTNEIQIQIQIQNVLTLFGQIK